MTSHMITIRDRRTGEDHRGRSPETIARRLYGTRAEVRYSPDPNTPWQAVVVTPARGQVSAYNVEGEWFLDDAALAAAEHPDLDQLGD